MKRVFGNAAIAMALAMGAGQAQAEAVRMAAEGVVACQAILDPMQKLACFEAAADVMSSALATPQAAVVPKETVINQASNATSVPSVAMQEANLVALAAAEEPDITKKRSLLPSWIPTVSFNIGSGEDKAEQPDTYDVQVTRIQRNKLGRHFFTTSEGQVWRQIQVEDIKAPSGIPADATLIQGFGSSIRIRFADVPERTYNVVRVE